MSKRTTDTITSIFGILAALAGAAAQFGPAFGLDPHGVQIATAAGAAAVGGLGIFANKGQ